MDQGRRLGQDELLEVIGQGEMITLYRARDTERGEFVILKLVHAHVQDDPDLATRFRDRSDELLHLRHPHIVPVLDAITDHDASYLVSGIPAGESLEQRLAGHGPVDVDSTLSIIPQVAEALDYAHEQGAVHHDVRPSNIYIKGSTAVLTDFFLLEAIGATPTYVAPEQLDETSAEVADRRSDVYALGVVVYEMLTGRPPFEGTSADVAAAHLTQRPLSPRVHNPDLFPALDAILLKALAKQPASRYQSASALAVALHEAVQTARTLRMADDGVFDSRTRASAEAIYRPTPPSDEGGVPEWAWVGLGIFLAVIMATLILLATGRG
jgi:serine/threonine-protein kinase